MRYAMFILYVRDQQTSRDFYARTLGLEPVLDVPGMTEFQLTDSAILGLMPEAVSTTTSAASSTLRCAGLTERLSACRSPAGAR
jgi:catechol 2,3-dioxygenase-like lactoylglutathione lyase family enzyme